MGTVLDPKVKMAGMLSNNGYQRKIQLVADQDSLALTPESAAAAASFQT